MRDRSCCRSKKGMSKLNTRALLKKGEDRVLKIITDDKMRPCSCPGKKE